MDGKSVMGANKRGIVKRKRYFHNFHTGKRRVATRYRSKLKTIDQLIRSLTFEEKGSNDSGANVREDSTNVCIQNIIRNVLQGNTKSDIKRLQLQIPVQEFRELRVGTSIKGTNRTKHTQRCKARGTGRQSKRDRQRESSDMQDQDNVCCEMLTECDDLVGKVPFSCKAHRELHPCCPACKQEQLLEPTAIRSMEVEAQSSEQETINVNGTSIHGNVQSLFPSSCSDKPYSEDCKEVDRSQSLLTTPMINVPSVSAPKEAKGLECKNQYSPSPPNSPLYDMPPPSTPAQRQARSAKRCLQLERWRKFEALRSRQERYERRAQQQKPSNQTGTSGSQHVWWSVNLVETIYFPNLSNATDGNHSIEH